MKIRKLKFRHKQRFYVGMNGLHIVTYDNARSCNKVRSTHATRR